MHIDRFCGLIAWFLLLACSTALFAAEPPLDPTDANANGPPATLPAIPPSSGGPLATFGSSTSPVTFFGSGGNARKIVFLCDLSETTGDRVKAELKTALTRVKIPQDFDVIFLQEAAESIFSRDVLKKERLAIATAETKRNAVAFVEKIKPGKPADPIPALKAAFDRNPDLIYLATDRNFADNNAVLKTIAELNKPAANGKRVKINTILVTQGKPTDKPANADLAKLLETIATQSYGVYRQASTATTQPAK